MRAPRIAFAIALPVVSFLAPVLGVGNAAALPRDHDQGVPPDSPKFYFPRQIKRQLGPFVNITAPDITPSHEEQPSPGRSSASIYPNGRPESSSSSGGLDEFLSSLLGPTSTPSTGENNIHHPSDPNIDASPIPTDDMELGPSEIYSSSSSSIPDASNGPGETPGIFPNPTIPDSSPLPTNPEPLIPDFSPLPSNPLPSNPLPTNPEPLIPDSSPLPSHSPPTNPEPLIPNFSPLPTNSPPSNTNPEPLIPDFSPLPSNSPPSNTNPEPLIPNFSPLPSNSPPSNTNLEPLIPNFSPLPTNSPPSNTNPEPLIPNFSPLPSNSPPSNTNPEPLIPNFSPLPTNSPPSNTNPEPPLPSNPRPSNQEPNQTPTIPDIIPLPSNHPSSSNPPSNPEPIQTPSIPDIISLPSNPPSSNLPTNPEPSNPQPTNPEPTISQPSVPNIPGPSNSQPTQPTPVPFPPPSSNPPVPSGGPTGPNVPSVSLSLSVPTNPGSQGPTGSGSATTPTGSGVPPSTYNPSATSGNTSNVPTNSGGPAISGAPSGSGISKGPNITSVPQLSGMSSGEVVPSNTGSVSEPSGNPSKGISSIYQPPTTTPAPSAEHSTNKQQYIRPPSSGVNPSSIWFQTSILVVAPAPSTTTAASTGGYAAATPSTGAAPTATALDPKLPKVITPADGMPGAPPDMILIRLGFTHPLNYQWVVSNPISVAQIFEYVPKGLNFGLSINSATMHSLQPYDTRANKGYITTLALAFIPKNLFDELDLQRRTPGSRLLNNPSKPVHDIMALLDPSIPLRASLDEQSGDGNGKLTNDGTSWSGSGSNSFSPDSGTSGGSPIDNKSGPISTKSLGIGAGVCVGALAYGGAMFFVARRYRQRRNKHNRANSMSRSISPGNIPGPMMGANPVAAGAMMHGARGTYGTVDRASKGSGGKASARGAISAPLMAANSLGWN
ncbi:hypothetical protein K440DRAFT_680967 [Wilcoxina mikolae CBS 423.85]|nr:hypothetical protein K440DRAFT_680967 [Wilcoxina mikolae CBS 423.85]